ncbi:MAG TPA: NAD(P)H-binding protein [Acidimicrobiales bacterium]|nr:NAD(P)H-binding protein [Acidimicrobiales bacterium]
MRIAVAGASGYGGTKLVPRLAAAGHEVVALARSVDSIRPGDEIEARAVDIEDATALTAALQGVDAAVYLVHSMAGGADFAERDRQLAATFAAAAATAGVRRIVYLGGLGGGDLSDHLASRHEVGETLASGAVPVVELRAAVILGSGSISFEMLRYLTERLPAMVCPRWIRTRIQPIAEVDLLAHLERSLDGAVAPGVYEVGGPDVTTYREMIAAYARVRHLRPRGIVDIPLLTPGLSAR